MCGKVMAVRLCDVILMAVRTERLTFTRNITASNTAEFGFRRTKQLKRTNKLPDAINVNKEESNIGNSFDSGSTTIHHLSEKRSCLPEEMKANRESNTTKVVKYGVDDSNDKSVRILDLSKKHYYKVVLWRNQS